MELAVEKWLHDQIFDEESVRLFNESIVCYKAGAYRAGFLFSYLGTQSVLKDRILRGDKPDAVRGHFWSEVLTGLRDEDEWEKTVWLVIEATKHGSIFGLGDNHLKDQLVYWKGIRNDCAHAKDNEIISAHVESYWAFLRSNLSKLVVSGGKDSIVNRIGKHFDRKYTPYDADPLPIIRDMESGVKGGDLIDVFKELERLTENDFYYMIEYPGSEVSLFWKNIMDLNNSVSRECVNFLKNRSGGVLYHILDAYPNLVSYFSGDNEFIRNLWYEKIGEFINPFGILASLLENDCIPPGQTEESIETVIRDARDTYIDQLTLQRLNNYGYSNIFKQKVFTSSYSLLNDFKWANSRSSLISNFLMSYELDTEIVKTLASTFSSPAHPFELRTVLKRLFNENTKVQDKIREIAEEESIVLPERLGF